MSLSLKTLRLALIQMAVGEDKGENIRRAIKLVNNAISEGSSLIVLPECFNCPYGTKYFPKYAEEIPGGETSKSLSEVAKQNRLFLVGGSIPEREGDKLYNTSTVWGPEGQLLCKHRKPNGTFPGTWSGALALDLAALSARNGKRMLTAAARFQLLLEYFPKYAEEIPGGETSKSLSEVAKQNRLFLVGGSIPEREGDKLYNTSTVWGPEGQLLCKHRKIHLFDIDIPGGITFKESDTLAPGSNLSIFNINNLKVGLGICYDLRFSELSRLYRKKGVDIILYPAAFNMTTGPLHWELLLRARAVDEQVFVAAVSPAQDSSADYVAWGHSMVVNPWGCILKQAKFEEELIVTDLDLQEIKKVRQQIPVFKQKRQDLYDTVDVKSKM